MSNSIAQLPNFLIVGAAKCGTTSLHNYFSAHPKVFMCPVKEPHFFDVDTLDTSDTTGQVRDYLANHFGEVRDWLRVKRLDDYKRLFAPGKNYRVRGESSTPYLYSRAAPKRIRDLNPDAKIVIVLRNPVARAYSHYQMDLREGVTDAPFVDAVNESLSRPWADWSSQYVRLGKYYNQVQRYLNQFPPDQVMIGFFDDLKKDTSAFCTSVCEFLGVKPIDETRHLRRVHNQAKAPRFQWVQWASTFAHKSHLRTLPMIKPVIDALKSYLYSSSAVKPLSQEEFDEVSAHFVDDVKNLSTLTGRDLTPWLHGLPLDPSD